MFLHVLWPFEGHKPSFWRQYQNPAEMHREEYRDIREGAANKTEKPGEDHVVKPVFSTKH